MTSRAQKQATEADADHDRLEEAWTQANASEAEKLVPRVRQCPTPVRGLSWSQGAHAQEGQSGCPALLEGPERRWAWMMSPRRLGGGTAKRLGPGRSPQERALGQTMGS